MFSSADGAEWSAAMSRCHKEMSNALLIFGYGASIMWLLIREAFVFCFSDWCRLVVMQPLFNNSFSWKIKALSFCSDIVLKNAHTHISCFIYFSWPIIHYFHPLIVLFDFTKVTQWFFFVCFFVCFWSMDGLSRQLFYRSERLAF